MTLSRALGAIGRFLITSGCMVLLFVAYQLWGTGIQAGAAQNDLASDFTALLESSAADDKPAPIAEPTVVPATVQVEENNVIIEATPTPAPTPTPTPVSKEFLEQLYPAAGEPISRVVIDKIGVDQVVVEGVGVEDLRKGPGRYRTTSLPGQAGNAAIAGHRTTYGAPFHRIDELIPGDEIQVQTLQGVFTYRVMDNDGVGHVIVSPDATYVLDDVGDNRLTLTACHPKYSARQRIIVFAELVGEPAETLPRPEDWEAPDEALVTEDLTQNAAETISNGEAGGSAVDTDATDTSAADNGADQTATDGADDTLTAATDVAADAPETAAVDTAVAAEAAETTGRSAGGLGSLEGAVDDDFGEGLSGDREAIIPAVAWGVAAMAIWFTGKFIGRRTKRMPAYVVALAPFALVLWRTFENIDRSLPSY